MKGRRAIREARRHLAEQNAKWTGSLEEMLVIPAAVPELGLNNPPRRAWRSRHFLVQLFADPNGFERLTVQRTTMRADGDWEDGITWDELMRCKAQAGYADRWAVEVYPPDNAIVWEANMRHLWLVPERPAYAWGG